MPEPGEREYEPAPVALRAPQLKCLLESSSGCGKRTFRELKVRTANEHRGPAEFVARVLEPRLAFVQEGVGSCPVAPPAGDPCLVGEDVADRRVAGDLD